MKKSIMIMSLLSMFILTSQTGCEILGGDCCKHCTNSKPCGDSCIPYSSTCHKPPGCACSGSQDSVYSYSNSDESQTIQEHNSSSEKESDSCCTYCSGSNDYSFEVITGEQTTKYKSGCACGNRCISCNNECSVVPGCACDF